MQITGAAGQVVTPLPLVCQTALFAAATAAVPGIVGMMLPKIFVSADGLQATLQLVVRTSEPNGTYSPNVIVHHVHHLDALLKAELCTPAYSVWPLLRLRIDTLPSSTQILGVIRRRCWKASRAQWNGIWLLWGSKANSFRPTMHQPIPQQ